jgi:hypothetical protein
MHSDDQSVTLRHREYIADVAMNGQVYTQQTFAINPGLFASFPFLSAVSANFQEYEFTGLVFEYKTTSSASLTSGLNTAMGSVMLAVQYRSDAAPFTSKQQLLNEMWSVDIVPSENCVLPVECSPKENPFAVQYIRTGPFTGDIKMFDLGVLSVATAGGQTGQTNIVGELWASYEVILKKPQIAVVGGVGASIASFQFQSTNYTNASPLGVTGLTSINSAGLSITPTVITFPFSLNGFFLIDIVWTAGTTVVFAPPTVTSTAGVIFGFPAITNSGLATTVGFTQFIVQLTGASGNTITFTGGTLPVGGFVIVLVTQLFTSPTWLSINA